MLLLLLLLLNSEPRKGIVGIDLYTALREKGERAL